jgi:hypothetical protein
MLRAGCGSSPSRDRLGRSLPCRRFSSRRSQDAGVRSESGLAPGADFAGGSQGEVRCFLLGEVEAGAGEACGCDAESADREVFKQLAVALARIFGAQLLKEISVEVDRRGARTVHAISVNGCLGNVASSVRATRIRPQFAHLDEPIAPVGDMRQDPAPAISEVQATVSLGRSLFVGRSRVLR